MNKLLTFAVGAICAAILVIPAVAAPQGQPERPDAPLKMELTKRPVIYDHAIHTAEDCMACHTTMPQHFPALSVDAVQRCTVCHHLVDGNFAPNSKCSDCHTEVDPRYKGEESYYRIAHGQNLKPGHTSCLSCHLDVIKTRPEKRQLLTSCAGSACHPQ